MGNLRRRCLRINAVPCRNHPARNSCGIVHVQFSGVSSVANISAAETLFLRKYVCQNVSYLPFLKVLSAGSPKTLAFLPVFGKNIIQCISKQRFDRFKACFCVSPPSAVKRVFSKRCYVPPPSAAEEWAFHKRRCFPVFLCFPINRKVHFTNAVVSAVFVLSD